MKQALLLFAWLAALIVAGAAAAQTPPVLAESTQATQLADGPAIGVSLGRVGVPGELRASSCLTACIVAVVTATASAQQRSDSTISPAVRAAQAVPTVDYFVSGAFSGILAGGHLAAVAFTDDKSVLSISLSALSIATFITKWRSASRVEIPPAAVREVRAPAPAEWSATYSAALTERRRSGLVVGLFTGSAVGVIMLFIRSLPET